MPPPLHWPGKKFLGPGTRDLEAIPVDEIDYIAKLHDIAYSEAHSDSDIFKADKAAIQEFLSAWHHDRTAISALAGSAGLSIKNFVEESLLGKSLYGMSKRPAPSTEKNWAAIKRINQHRQFNRQLIAAAEEAEQQQQQQDAPHDQIDTPPNSQSERDSSNTANIPNSSTSAMDVDTNNVDVRASGSGGSGGNAMGAGGQGDSDVYRGTPQQPNFHTKTFSKSYHFSISNGLPEWRRANYGSIGWVNTLRLQSVHGLPWERLAFYCSEGEIARLIRNYSYCEVEEVHCEVFSLGVRLPFITGQTTSLVANTLAQIPIARFTFDQDHMTKYDGAALNDTINKCWGSEWKTYNQTSTDFSNTFPNIPASTGNRVLNNPVHVLYPMVGSDQMWPKDVNIYDYVQIKNGSTTYGPAWSMTHKPKRGIFNAKSCESNAPTFNRENMTGRTLIPGGNHWATGNGALVDNYNGNNRVSLPDWYNNRNVIRSNINLSARNIQVDNNTLFAAGDARIDCQAMPKFLIGMVNIRNLAEGNTVNSVLEARWDVMVKCRIKIKCGDNVQPGYINRVVDNVPFQINPFTFLVQGETLGHWNTDQEMATGLYNKRIMQNYLPSSVLNEIKINIERIKNKEIDIDTVIKPYKDQLDKTSKHKVHHPEYVQKLKVLANPMTYNGTLTISEIEKKLNQ